jgi:hypothetical protein
MNVKLPQSPREYSIVCYQNNIKCIQPSTLTAITIRTEYSCFWQAVTGGMAAPGVTGNLDCCALVGEQPVCPGAGL